MIEKLIHQIFIDIGRGDITQFPIYQESSKSYQEKNPGWKYTLWDEGSIRELIQTHYPEIYERWDRMKHKISQIDVARYIIVYHCGGYYSDLDIVCNRSLDEIHSQEDEIFIVNYQHIENPTWKLQYAEQDFFGAKQHNDIIRHLIYYALDEYDKRVNMKIYETRRFRFIMQTTGCSMYSRFFKIHYPVIKIHNGIQRVVRQQSNIDESQYLLTDYHTNAWIDFKKKKVW